MSKQMEASKVLSTERLATAKALYLQWLRELVSKGVLGERSSPRRSPPHKRKVSNLFDEMGSDDDATATETPASDRVRSEVMAWESMSMDRVNQFKDHYGLVNEFRLMCELREEVPLCAQHS